MNTSRRPHRFARWVWVACACSALYAAGATANEPSQTGPAATVTAQPAPEPARTSQPTPEAAQPEREAAQPAPEPAQPAPEPAQTAQPAPEAAQTAPEAAQPSQPAPEPAQTAKPAPDVAQTAQPAPDAAQTAQPAPDAAQTAQAASEAAKALPGHRVMVGETEVVTLRVGSANASPQDRAQNANKLLASIAERDDLPEITALREGDTLVVYANKDAVLRLTEADVAGTSQSNLEDLGDAVASEIRWALRAEQRRGRIANNVLSLSLVVLFGLIGFYAMRRVGKFSHRGRVWVEAHAERLSLRIREVEILGPEMVQSALLIALGLLRFLGQVAILYTWTVVSLSLFNATRPLTHQLTGALLSPLSQLTTRLATTLPLLVVLSIAGLVVFVAMRFVGLFFASVAKRETTLSWVTPDLALPTSVILRVGIVMVALLFVAPVVTGDPDGVFPRVGMVALGTLGLSSVPLVASALVGASWMFSRRLRVGDHVDIASIRGRVTRFTLLQVVVETELGHVARVPSLSLLRSPVLLLPRSLPRTAVVRVPRTTNVELVERALRDGGHAIGDTVTIRLSAIDGAHFDYAVTVSGEQSVARGAALKALVAALAHAGVEVVTAQEFES